MLQSITGGAAFIGAQYKDGALLAAEEINRKQELGAGNTLKVTVADDSTDRAQTLALIKRYASDPSVLMILGPTSGAVAVAGAQAANDLKVPLLATSNSTDVLKAGPWSYILTQPGTTTLPFIANYAVEKLQVKNCTVIGIHDVEIYVSMQKVFEDVVKSRGTKIGSVEAIKGSDSDFSALATKVVGRDQDCVFISATAPQAANIIIQLRQAGLDPKTRIMGHNALSSPQFVDRGGKAVEGVYLIGDWVPGGSDDFSRAFNTSYKTKYNSEADNWAAVGYGGMRVAVAALKAAGPNPTRDAVRQAMAKTKDVPVAVGQGKYSLNAERVPFSGMRVLQIKDGKFVPAP
ncbi:ABC transporter substrate-binding protein [Polaromonas sp. P1-6]|nr:ABC transporter substrate-binding protein [Polaromonas sp. P1-6]